MRGICHKKPVYHQLTCISFNGPDNSSVSLGISLACDNTQTFDIASTDGTATQIHHLLLKDKTGQQGDTLLHSKVIEGSIEYHLSQQQFITSV